MNVPLTLAPSTKTPTTNMCSISSCNYTPTPPPPAVPTCPAATFIQKSRSHVKSCFAKYPSLDDILSNQSSYPYNLTTFIGFLSQNHCLETVEFIMDVTKYSETYEKANASQEVLLMMWRRIVDTYIRPGGPKELNLPCEVRSRFISTDHPVAPLPSSLETPFELVKEMIKENAYVPFITSVKCAASSSSSSAHTTTPSRYPRNIPETCLQSLSTCSPFGSHESSESTESSKSDCSWHQPESWGSDYMSKSSSTASLHTGDEEQGLNRATNPMTPPESPLSFTEPSTRFSTGSSTNLSHLYNQAFPTSPNGTEKGHIIPRHHSHWRKMSQRLKWRRSSDKDLNQS